MPALWQASQRPMYVRTVWVDGFRHAILSEDDPHYLNLSAKKRRPHSSASVKLPKRESRLSTHSEDLEDCLRKFNLVVRKERISLPNPRMRPKTSKSIRIENLDLTDVDNESDEEQLLLQATPQPLNEYDTSRSNYNMRTFKANKTSRSESKQCTELSERVLQWLDLAGKVDLLAPDNAQLMTQPRHSWPEIQRRNHNLSKSKTAVDVRPRENVKMDSPKVCDSSKAQLRGIIDRHDFYVPSSANTIENYARQSRNGKNTLRAENGGKTKDIHNMKKESRLNVAETRQKVVTERTAVEKQYAELVSRKLIPNLAPKKQVHIFMPELPKKPFSNSTSRTESLLSQKI